MTPTEWVPTKRPLEQVAFPDILPTKATRTAAIWNNARDKTDPWRGQSLWLNRVATGWNLNGSFGQAQKNRIFYPRNLSQQALTIEGQMPNQYQYDRLVYWVKQHQHDALNHPGAEQQPATFLLPQNLLELPGKSLRGYRADAYFDGEGKIVRRYYRAINVDGYVLGIAAGHTRWQFAPRFTMDILISNDYIDEKVELTSEMDKLLHSSGATYAQDNAPLTKNYRRSLNVPPDKGDIDPSAAITLLDSALNGPGGVKDLAANIATYFTQD